MASNVSFADQSSISGNGSMLNITAYSDRSASVNRVCRSSSYSKPTRRTDPTMGYRLFGSESSVYDLGTAVNSDENRKGTVDENGVVSRISG
uniref:Uncharacterized protein n=1 Tax=Parascaris equorum TaxID=6256 RepID=A0A914R043_PAREQ